MHLSTHESSTLSLHLERVIKDGRYAGNLAVVNVVRLLKYNAENPVRPWRVDSPREWKRTCACQLYNGSTELPGEETLDDSLGDNPQGTAFYKWYYALSGFTYTELTAANRPQWLQATFFADGTMGNEVTVDLQLVDDVRLRCRAGYLPYGEYVDFLDDGGKLRTAQAFARSGYGEQNYHLRVRMPKVEQADIAAQSYHDVGRKVLGSTTAQVTRRLLVKAAGTTLNDMQTSAAGGVSAVEKLCNIKWYKEQAGVAREISGETSEFLNKTPAELGLTLANVGALPAVYAAVNTKTKAQLISVGKTGQVATGMYVTDSPQDGDALVLDANGDLVWLSGGSRLEGISLPQGWEVVGYGFGRQGNSIRVLDKDDYADQWLGCWQYAITAITATSVTLNLRMRDTSVASADQYKVAVPVTIELPSTEISAANAAIISAAVAAKAASVGDTAPWWAWFDRENSRIVVQTDACSNYQQYQVSGTGCRVALCVWDDLPANSSGNVTLQNGLPALPVMNVATAVTYYGNSGDAEAQPVTSTSIMKPAAFQQSPWYSGNGGSYATYEDYIASFRVGAGGLPSTGVYALPDGKTMTARYARAQCPLLGSRTPQEAAADAWGGATKFKFPALHRGYSVAYNAEGLEEGCWHLSDIEDAVLYMEDDAYAAIRASQGNLGTTQLTIATRWLCRRYHAYNAWIFYGTNGRLIYYNVAGSSRVRAATLLQI